MQDLMFRADAKAKTGRKDQEQDLSKNTKEMSREDQGIDTTG
jgi:hypothetical protein